MGDVEVLSKEQLDGFSDSERWEAEDMVRRFGPDAENRATTAMIEALDGGDVQAIISRLRVRRCIRKLTHKEPYMRRLTDKIAAAVPNASLDLRLVDLADLVSVRDFAASFAEAYPQLDLLVLNAGVMIPPASTTPSARRQEQEEQHVQGVSNCHAIPLGMLVPSLRTANVQTSWMARGSPVQNPADRGGSIRG